MMNRGGERGGVQLRCGASRESNQHSAQRGMARGDTGAGKVVHIGDAAAAAADRVRGCDDDSI